MSSSPVASGAAPRRGVGSRLQRVPFWPGPHQLRRLFRSFDTDGDGNISPAELKRGLEALVGFELDHSILRNLQAEMAQGSSGAGLIREAQFLQAFRSLNRERLISRLKSQPSSREGTVRVSVVRVGHKSDEDGNFEACFEHHRLPKWDKLADELNSNKGWSSETRWFDISGVHSDCLHLLCNELSLPPDSLLELETASEQAAFTEFYPPHTSEPTLDEDLPEQSVEFSRSTSETSPLQTSSTPPVLKLVLHRLHLQNAPCHIDKQGKTVLVARSEYMSYRPRVVAMPIFLLMIGDHTVVTIRPQSTISVLNNVFDDLIRSLAESLSPNAPASSASSILSLNSARPLAMEILNEIVEQNWIIRDYFKDWKDALTESIRNGTEDYQLLHVMDMEHSGLTSLRVLKPAVSLLRDMAAKRAKKKASHAHNQSKDISMARSDYLHDVEGDIRALSRTYVKLYDQISFSVQMSRTLKNFYTQRREEQINRVLYVLTVATTIVTPTLLLSSVYGMNFDVLPEIHYEYGYPIFWIVNITLIFLISLWFKRKNLL